MGSEYPSPLELTWVWTPEPSRALKVAKHMVPELAKGPKTQALKLPRADEGMEHVLSYEFANPLNL